MGLDTSRVLRIGVVYRGQIVAERVLDRRADVTVGTRPDSTVQISPKDYPEFPSQIALAAVHQGGYHLLLPTDPKHGINLRGGPQGLGKDAVVQVKGAKAVSIEAYTGGSVSMGDIILMFQFVRGDSVPTVTREETVLRIGLVHEDRLLSDQVFHAGAPVTIGTGAKATISLPDVDYKGATATFKSEKNATQFVLQLPKASTFRLALDGQPPVDVQEALAKKIATQTGEFYELTLPAKARGKATLGPYTLLYQVVKQSVTVPAVPRKSLVSQILGPLVADSTWTMSFLVALILIGSVVGQAIVFHRTTGRFIGKAQQEEENAATIYEVQVEQKEEEKPEEEKKAEIDIVSESAKKEQEKEDKRKEDKKPKQQAPAEKPQSTGKTVDPEEAKRNARQAVTKNTIAGAFTGSTGAATKLFGAAGEGEEGTVVAKTFGGGGGSETTGPGGSGLKIENSGGGGGTVEKVATGKKGGFGDREADATKTAEKKEEKTVTIKLSGGGMEGGDGESKGEVAKVVSRKNSAVQRCYETALRDNPDEGGKVKVSFTVGTAGTVTDVSVSGASGAFADCIKSKFQSIRGLPLLPNPQSFTQSYVFTKS